MPQLQNVNDNVETFKAFVGAAFAMEPLFIIFYIVIGTIIGLICGYLFIGVGKTEQRLIGQNYASGFRTGYQKGRDEQKMMYSKTGFRRG